jgi:hypothetical protein
MISWDEINKTMGALGTSAGQISSAYQVLTGSKNVATDTRVQATPNGGGNSMLMVIAAIAALLILKK